jgi:diguanylate cyclase (GGDEF)-like protein
MTWQRPSIGSRVTREGHARFWERPEVKFLRATRQTLPGVTLSVGVAEFPRHAGSVDGLIRCADRALYASKKAGRDRIEVLV